LGISVEKFSFTVWRRGGSNIEKAMMMTLAHQSYSVVSSPLESLEGSQINIKLCGKKVLHFLVIS